MAGHYVGLDCNYTFLQITSALLP